MDIDALLAELTVDEKASMTAGADMWSVPGVERLDIPPMRVTDGPNGARGSALLGAGGPTAACVPCGSALGATWDVELVERVGHLLGQEARTKGCRVLLAPTINLHRSPIAGRNFECYSEDPLLAGRAAAAFVRGVQAEGVATTPKHFVANEAEFERQTISSDVDERALHELYLVPFEHAVTDGGALGIMTSYNRLNGEYCSEARWLLEDVLRSRWGFEGFVVTDWLAAGSTAASAEAGLDLEMPGPGRFFGRALAEAVKHGEVAEDLLDAQVRRHLTVMDRLCAWGDGADPPEEAVDLPEHRALAREAAADATVLLRNDGVLPFDAAKLSSLALIGPNAGRAHLMGGGSAQLRAHYVVPPSDPISERLDDRVTHEPGCDIDRSVRAVGPAHVASGDGEAALDVAYYATDDWSGEVVRQETAPSGRLLWFGSPGDGVPDTGFSVRATGRLVPPETGTHRFTLIQAGRARVLVDGDVVLDGIEDPPPRGREFFGTGSEEITADVELEAGRPVDLVVEYTSRDAAILYGVKVGYQPPVPDDLLERAVAAAAAADAAVVVVGTSDEWESEGHDRTSMDLPGDQDELIRRVAAANPRTVVVVNTGAPVTMDWADDVAAVLQVWLGGQEMASALDAVLFGEAEPAGRLPTTIPLALEHNPSYGSFPGENSHVAYSEGLLVGYRWYRTRRLPVRYPFGHGGSYTTFEWGTPSCSDDSYVPGAGTTVTVPVTNTGDRRGAEVVQCYLRPVEPRLFRPELELAGYAKLWLDPGESADAVIELGDRAFAYWDPGDRELDEVRAKLAGGGAIVPATAGATRRTERGWYVDEGRYEVCLGRSVDDLAATLAIDVTAGAGPL